MSSDAAATPQQPKESDFEEEKQIGRGGMADVILVRRRNYGDGDETRYALKRGRWPLHKLDTTEQRRAIEESVLLRAITCGEAVPAEKHRLFCKFFGSFEDSNGKFALVLEYIPGMTLVEELREQPGGYFSLEAARPYLATIVRMLDLLHSCGIIYRDLKLTNLIVSKPSGCLRLVDFGFAKRLQPGRTGDEKFRRTYSVFGSPHTFAPETFVYDQKMNEDGFYEIGYTFSPDWWSLGVMACELLAGQPPFGYRDGDIAEGESIQKLAAASPISIDWEGRLAPLSEHPAAKEFASSLLAAAPEKRLGVEVGGFPVHQHPVFEGLDWEAEQLRTASHSSSSRKEA